LQTPIAGQTPISTDLTAVQLDADRRIARLTLAVMLVPTFWFLRTDLTIAVAELVNLRFAVRALFVGFLLAGIWGLRPPITRPTYERLILIVGVGTALCIFALNALRPAHSTLPLRTPLMWLFAYYAGLHSRPALQLIPPLLISAGLTGLRLFWVDSGASGTIDGDILVIAVLNVLGILLVRNRAAVLASESALWASRQRAHEARERAMAELRTLRGIIPICSYCREVKTEVGDWTRLESYVREHSAAEFSHGICPDCEAEQFPAVRGNGDTG
jgi:hypothetical protein